MPGRITWLPINLSGLDQDNASQIASFARVEAAELACNGATIMAAQQRRTAIYSDNERRHMCRSLAQSIPHSTVDSALDSLERESHRTRHHGQLQIGPFSAFSLPTSAASGANQATATASSRTPADLSTPVGKATSTSSSSAVTPPQDAIPDSLSPVLVDAETIERTSGTCPIVFPDFLSNDTWQPFMWPQQDVLDMHVPDMAESTLDPGGLDFLDQQEGDEADNPEDIGAEGGLSMPINLSTESSMRPDNPAAAASAMPSPDHLFSFHSLDVSDVIPDDARFLLEHYKFHHLKMFSPIWNHKSPWRIMHLPTALQTFATLLLTGNDTCIRTSIFYSVMAVSAFTADRLSSTAALPSRWNDAGCRYHQRARAYLQMGLKTEIVGTKKVKYKEMLMAFLGMIALCIVSGRFLDAQPFLFDLENLIYSWGCRKTRISRKVAMLHNIFLYIKTLQETTGLPRLGGKVQDLRSEAHYPRLVENLFLYENSEDHHRTGGNGTKTLESAVFERIYGVPFSLICLISRVTALERRVTGVHDKFTLDHLQNEEIRKLETDICEWVNPFSSPTCDEDPASLPSGGRRETAINQLVMRGLVGALHHAVLIFFYRRILDVHPYTLQPYVRLAISDLVDYEEKKAKYEFPNIGIAWPAFIVGCEAQSQEDRRQITRWFVSTTQSSGIKSFCNALDAVQEVWANRDRGQKARLPVSQLSQLSQGLILT